jgi:hypothetical protein
MPQSVCMKLLGIPAGSRMNRGGLEKTTRLAMITRTMQSRF